MNVQHTIQCPGIYLQGVKKTTEKVSQDSWFRC